MFGSVFRFELAPFDWDNVRLVRALEVGFSPDAVRVAACEDDLALFLELRRPPTSTLDNRSKA